MSYFDQLPNEVVLHILHFLDAEGLARAGSACRRLHELTHVDSLWEALCRQKCGLTSTEGWGEAVTFYEIYSKVLHRYGDCLGLWRSDATAYGLCVNVKLEKGELVARFLNFPKTENVQEALRWSKPVFKVALKDGEGEAICGKDCPPSAGVHLKRESSKLQYKCEKCQRAVLSLSEEEVFSMWVTETRPDLDTSRPDLIFKGFSVARLTKLWSNYTLDEIPPAVQSPVSPIRLGLYKGTYGSHGIEIIKLSLSENGYELLGDKILGDPNVPAGKISLYIDLRRPITLTEEQQEFDFVDALDPDTLPSPYRFPPNASQPFSLSDNIFMRDTQRLPTTCKARYAGRGQIAAHGYINPDVCRCQFVVFSEDYFGCLWLDLTSFSVFRLADSDFS